MEPSLPRQSVLKRFIPAPMRRWLRAATTPMLRKFVEERICSSPFIDGRHIPLAALDDHYVIPFNETRVDAASPDGLPIPPQYLWWDYAKTAERYLEIGRNNVEKLRENLRAHGGDIQPGDRVLDFGCAAGPQTRCLLEFARTGEVWGVDASAPHVSWCIHNLPTSLRFACTTMGPHLPFEDRYFDVIFAGSVFSHIGEMADAWLLELARITRPGGRLHLSFNTKQSMYAYLKHWPDLEVSRRINADLTEAEIKSNFATAVVGRDLWQHSIYDGRTFLQECERMCEVLALVRNSYSYQTVVILRRLDKSRPR